MGTAITTPDFNSNYESVGNMMRSEAEAERAIGCYADTVRRICFMHLKKTEDVEDAFQEVFLKYILHDREFESHAHEKAWLIRVAINVCKDMLRNPFRKRVCSIEDINIEPFTLQNSESKLLDYILAMPAKYKDVIYLLL